MRGTWKTESSGAGALAVLAVVLIVAIIGAAVARPVIDAVTELVRVLLIAAAVLAGTAVAGGIAYVVWRRRHPRPIGTRPAPFISAAQLRAIQGRSAPRQLPPAEQHIHFHGVSADDIAAIIASQRHSPGED